jgi:licheninase
MQLKNFYSKVGILGFATVMALTACGDDNSDAQFAVNPGTSQQNPGTEKQQGSDTPTTPDSTVTTPTDSNTTLPQGELPAEGPIDLPSGLGVLVDDFEDGNHESKIGDYWYTYDDQSNNGASVLRLR